MLLSYRALWPILFAMPDIHWGYGFPIGGVAATSLDNGVISPGGVGFDINCLSPDALILHPFGYTLEIRKFEKLWAKEEIKKRFEQLQKELQEIKEEYRTLQGTVRNKAYLEIKKSLGKKNSPSRSV